MYLKFKPSFHSLIANLNNGVASRSSYTKAPSTNFNYKILEILCRLGYLESFKLVNENDKKYFLVFFKFDVNGKQCLQRLRVIKNLDRQIKFRHKLIKNLKKGDKIFKGTWLISTFSSILTDDEALIRNLTGVRFLLIT